jgi:hypothetical protein
MVNGRTLFEDVAMHGLKNAGVGDSTLCLACHVTGGEAAMEKSQWRRRAPPCGGRSENFCLSAEMGRHIVILVLQWSMSISTSFRITGLEVRPPLWSSGESSWLQIQRSRFDSRRYHIFWEVVGLERSPVSLMSTFEELLERKSSDSGLENREYGRRDPSRWPRGTLYPLKLALSSPTSGGRSVDIVFSRTKATELLGLKLRARPEFKYDSERNGGKGGRIYGDVWR